MSENFEPCTLEEATHVEVNSKMYKLGGNEVVRVVREYYHNDWIGLRWYEGDAFIPLELFSTLGIKTLKEIKPEPIVFEAVFAKSDGKWHPLYSLDDGFAYQKAKKVRFKCVEILEDEE